MSTITSAPSENRRFGCLSSCLFNTFSDASAIRRRNEPFLLLLVVEAACLLYAGMGAAAFGHCPAQPALPYWTAAAGCLGAAAVPVLACCLRRRRWKSTYSEASVACETFVLVAVALVLFAWWLLGSVLIYSAYPGVTDHDPARADYCDPVAFHLGFQLQNLSWVALGLAAFYLLSMLLDERVRFALRRTLERLRTTTNGDGLRQQDQEG